MFPHDSNKGPESVPSPLRGEGQGEGKKIAIPSDYMTKQA